jgi:hypothetical protein
MNRGRPPFLEAVNEFIEVVFFGAFKMVYLSLKPLHILGDTQSLCPPLKILMACVLPNHLYSSELRLVDHFLQDSIEEIRHSSDDHLYVP